VRQVIAINPGAAGRIILSVKFGKNDSLGFHPGTGGARMTRSIRAALACAIVAALPGCGGRSTGAGEPTLAASAADLSFGTSLGANPPEQTRGVANSGTGTLAAVTATPSYTDGAGWLSLTVTGSGNAQTLHVSVTAPAAAGLYEGAVTISSLGASNSPVIIPVYLVVSDTSTPLGGARAIVDTQYTRSFACALPPISTPLKADEISGAGAEATTLAASVSAGRLAYSQSQADACLAYLNSSTCAVGGQPSAAPFPACNQVFVGQVPNGNSCVMDCECANGYCAIGTVCPGSCAAFLAVGASCGAARTTAACGPGNFCAWNGSDHVCAVSTPPGGAGESCSNGSSCATGYYCHSGVCTPVVAEGGVCTMPPFLTTECAAGLACGSDSRCHPIAGLGQSCATSTCAIGFYCSAASHTCATPPTLGQDCSDANAFCMDSYCIGTTTKACVAGAVAVGDSCSVYAGAASDPATLCARFDGSMYYSCNGSTCAAMFFRCY
jgi:hypothetical protein